MPTVIDSAPSSITIPRDGHVEFVILAHNDDGQAPVLGSMVVRVGDQDVTITATVPGTDATPVVFGNVTLSETLLNAGVGWVNAGNGTYRVFGPDALT